MNRLTSASANTTPDRVVTAPEPSLMENAHDVFMILDRIEGRVKEIKGILFGPGLEAKEGAATPDPLSLQDFVKLSGYKAEQIENELNDILRRMTGS